MGQVFSVTVSSGFHSHFPILERGMRALALIMRSKLRALASNYAFTELRNPGGTVLCAKSAGIAQNCKLSH